MDHIQGTADGWNPALANWYRELVRTPNGQPRRLNLTNTEKAALVAFLQTLTDDSFIHDPKFSNPFLTHTLYLPLLQR